MIWNFEFTYNNLSTFLDMDAEWEVELDAKNASISKVVLGIEGVVPEESDKRQIEAYQANSSLHVKKIPLHDNCTSLEIPLTSTIRKGESGRIKIKYKVDKFIVDNYHDDYLYLYPYSQATKIRFFEISTKHPYKCNARVFLMEYQKRSGKYERTEMTKKTREINDKNKVKIKETNEGKEHCITIDNMNPKDVLLVIFEKTS